MRLGALPGHEGDGPVLHAMVDLKGKVQGLGLGL